MRYWEIDFARGTAVILMVIFHIFFDSYYVGKIPPLEGEFWYYFPRFIASMFIFISGLSLSISCRKNCLRRAMKKASKLALLALLITVVTYLSVREGYVVFGILHFLSLATLIGLAFVKKPVLSFFSGITAFILGIYLMNFRFDTYLFLWVGLIPRDFYTLDYFPLLPWFGVFLFGLTCGSLYRPFRDVKFPFRDLVILLGRNSLKIYLIQHPLILLALHLVYGDVLQKFIVLPYL
jgi:uncharacterized membrane protein